MLHLLELDELSIDVAIIEAHRVRLKEVFNLVYFPPQSLIFHRIDVLVGLLDQSSQLRINWLCIARFLEKPRLLLTIIIFLLLLLLVEPLSEHGYCFLDLRAESGLVASESQLLLIDSHVGHVSQLSLLRNELSFLLCVLTICLNGMDHGSLKIISFVRRYVLERS